MENPDDTDRQYFCLLCESDFLLTGEYTELEKAMESRHLPWVKHISTRHLDFRIIQQADAIALTRYLFKSTNDIVKEQKSIIELLKFFIDYGANVTARDRKGITLLHLAVTNRLKEVVDFLISRGENLDLRDAFGNPILHFLIECEARKFQECSEKEGSRKQSIDFMRWMILKGLNVDCANMNGETTLHVAARCKLFYALPVLLEHTRYTNTINKRNMTAFQVFAESVPPHDKDSNSGGNEDWSALYEAFLRKGFSANVSDDCGRTPLHHALNQARFPVIYLILKHFTNVNASDQFGNTALHVVMRNMNGSLPELLQVNYQEAARILASKGANVYHTNGDGISPILAAVMDERTALLDIFEEYGNSICFSYKGDSLLHSFCELLPQKNCKNPCRVIDFLVSKGCDVNAKDSEGKTPLHYAARCGKIEVIETLIEWKADVNIQESNRGYTPLHEAVKSYCDSSAEVLIANGADVNARTREGQTPLHLCGSKSMTLHLIQTGAHVDVPDNRGFLPLHKVILDGDEDAFSEFLRFGADINDNIHVVTDNRYFGARGFITEHLIKLRAAKLPIHERLKFLFLENAKAPILHRKCMTEIRKSKRHNIGDGKSIYDFLHMNRNTANVWIRREKLTKLFQNVVVLQRKFPLYHELITSTYLMAVQRRQTLLEPAKQAFSELTGVRLPELCLREIFVYLSNVSLRSIIEGAKLTDE